MRDDSLYGELPDSIRERVIFEPPPRKSAPWWGPTVLLFIFFAAFSWIFSLAVPVVKTCFDMGGVDMGSLTKSVVTLHFFFRAHWWLWLLIGFAVCALVCHPAVRGPRWWGWLVFLPFALTTTWVVWAFLESMTAGGLRLTGRP